jgi:hypothetical protein
MYKSKKGMVKKGKKKMSYKATKVSGPKRTMKKVSVRKKR